MQCGCKYLEEEKRGSWGDVLRDQNGATVCSAWNVIPHYQSVAMGEAIACLHGLELALNNSEQNIVVEIDCLVIIEAFRQGSLDRSEVSMIGKEFRQKSLQTVRLFYLRIGRNCNFVAHALCQLARREVCGVVLQGSVSTCALSLILYDYNPNNVD
jgi:hypothetical protein